MFGLGLGKQRTKFGKWVDKNLTQDQVREYCGLNKNTLTDVCNKIDHNPNVRTKTKIISGLRKKGFDVQMSDFWE